MAAEPGKYLRIVLGVFLLVAWAGGAAQAAGLALPFERNMAELEQSSNGRIGVALLDADGRTVLAYREDERFPLCSTFKAVLAAAILKHGETDGGFLGKTIVYGQQELVSWSPVTEKNRAKGMTVLDLCAAAVRHSDNTAANLLMRERGGPEGVTAFARSVGDTVFSLDRWETELNAAEPGDARDTTSPLAMAETLRSIVLGDVLSPEGRTLLQGWLKSSTTGDGAIRAGLPEGWTVGDKTGSGSYGTTNDIAVIWPPSGPPFVLAVYFTQTRKDAPSRRDVLAEAARVAVTTITGP